MSFWKAGTKFWFDLKCPLQARVVNACVAAI